MEERIIRSRRLEGVEFYTNGDFYEGEFHKGSGVYYYFFNGSCYIGEFKCGVKHGFGCYHFSEAHNSMIATLGQQYENVNNRTLNDNDGDLGSHVMEYGTMGLKSETLHHFQGFLDVNFSAELSEHNDVVMEGVDQRNADFMYLQRKYNKLADGSEEKAQLLSKITEIMNYRAHLDSSIDKIGSFLFGEGKGNSVLGYQGLPVVDDWGCLKSMVLTFETHCGSLTSYGMKHMGAFANVCNNGVASLAMEEASEEACRGYNLGQWDPAIRGYSVAD